MKKQDYDVEFKVLGAGGLRISHEPNCETGGEFGFSFDVEWGRYGYVGGVITIEEAEILAHQQI